MTAIGLIDNLLYPFLVGHRIRLHTLVAFFAILGGATTFGMSGIVLGPVIVALSLALVDIWRHRTAAGQSARKARLSLLCKLLPDRFDDQLRHVCPRRKFCHHQYGGRDVFGL